MILPTNLTAEEIYGAAAAAGARPDPLLTISQWADRYRWLSQRASAEHGRWRTERTPYLREIMDWLSPMSPIERTVFMKLVGRAANQLGGDANSVGLSHYRSFHNGIHMQQSGDLRHRELRILESHHRCAGNNAQIVHPGKAVDEGVGHPVNKVFLCWIPRQVLQRQHR